VGVLGSRWQLCPTTVSVADHRGRSAEVFGRRELCARVRDVRVTEEIIDKLAKVSISRKAYDLPASYTRK
jgi:hypothetical protein